MKQKRATIQPLIHHQSTLQSNLNLIMITEELSPSPLDFSFYPWAYWILILIMYNYTIALDHYLLCICHYKQKVSSDTCDTTNQTHNYLSLWSKKLLLLLDSYHFFIYFYCTTLKPGILRLGIMYFCCLDMSVNNHPLHLEWMSTIKNKKPLCDSSSKNLE